MDDTWDKQTAINKAARFCAYQERSELEVRKKLKGRITNPAIIEEIIERLTDEGFLNEDRFTDAFVKGKFFQKNWGKIKIRFALRSHAISEEKINESLERLIPAKAYEETVNDLITSKINRTKEKSPLKLKGKVFQHLAGKGFEQDVIFAAWDRLGFDV